MSRVSFGDFVLDLDARELLRGRGNGPGNDVMFWA